MYLCWAVYKNSTNNFSQFFSFNHTLVFDVRSSFSIIERKHRMYTLKCKVNKVKTFKTLLKIFNRNTTFLRGRQHLLKRQEKEKQWLNLQVCAPTLSETEACRKVLQIVPFYSFIPWKLKYFWILVQNQLLWKWRNCLFHQKSPPSVI